MRFTLPHCMYPISFRRDPRGATALEFALVAPVLLLMVCGTLEFSIAMFAQQVMEGATSSTSRSGKTGYVDAGKTQLQTILATLQKQAGMLLDMNKVTVSTLSYSQFDQIGQPEPFTDTNHNNIRDPGENYTDINQNGQYDTDMGASDLGTGSEVVVYTISYPWPIATPIVSKFFGSDGTLMLTSRTIVKNEPY